MDKPIDARSYVCENCDALFPPKKVTNHLSSAWRIDSAGNARELRDQRAVKCECGVTSLVPKVNSVLAYLDIVEDIISFHLLDSPWIESYLMEGKVEASEHAWNISFRKMRNT